MASRHLCFGVTVRLEVYRQLPLLVEIVPGRQKTIDSTELPPPLNHSSKPSFAEGALFRIRICLRSP